MTITEVDTAEKIESALDELEHMVRGPLIVISDIEVIKYTHSHTDAALPIPREGRPGSASG